MLSRPVEGEYESCEMAEVDETTWEGGQVVGVQQEGCQTEEGVRGERERKGGGGGGGEREGEGERGKGREQ